MIMKMLLIASVRTSPNEGDLTANRQQAYGRQFWMETSLRPSKSRVTHIQEFLRRTSRCTSSYDAATS